MRQTHYRDGKAAAEEFFHQEMFAGDLSEGVWTVRGKGGGFIGSGFADAAVNGGGATENIMAQRG